MSPWVRLDEHALNHSKILGLSHGAFRLWVEGLAHCQKHLTDGAITAAALRGFRYFRRAWADELAAALWEVLEDGYQVHDYLQWNDSKAKVLDSREKSKTRFQRFQKRATNAAATPLQTGTQRVSPTTTTTTTTEDQERRAAAPDARSKRPIFRGQRFVVFEWMLDDLRKLLGSHFEAFDLHAWFFALDAEAEAAGVVVPQRDGGRWLQERTTSEAIRRGLPLAAAPSVGKTSGNAAAAARFVARGAAS